MPGTPKKTAPRSAPAPTVELEPAVEPFNVLDVLAHDGGEPQPITVRGIDAVVLRRYTGDEAVKFHAYIATNEIIKALDVITGGCGKQIWDAVMGLKLDSARTATILNKVISLSGLSEGELVPHSPASAARMAGAVLNQVLDAGSTATSENSSEPLTGETADA